MVRTPKLGLPLQTLRNAPDALEGRRQRGGIIEISPDQVVTDDRFEDRLGLEVDGLKASVAQHGQRVPVLVRALGDDRYGLIYGRRRMQAAVELGLKLRAIVTDTTGAQSLRDQLIENQERRDLSFIERALVAQSLLEDEHLSPSERSNKGVAEVMGLTEAGVSQLVGVVRAVGKDLILAIGPAPSIGRPRWEELKKLMLENEPPVADLLVIATEARSAGGDSGSETAFIRVLEAAKPFTPPPPRTAPAAIDLPGIGSIAVATGRRGKELKLSLTADDKNFATWFAAQSAKLVAEMHAQWRDENDQQQGGTLQA